MEKKRRARINDSLETLKQILLESKTTILNESASKRSGQRTTAKLEKADILEMTVRYLLDLKNRIQHAGTVRHPDQSLKMKEDEKIKIRPADSSCDIKYGVALLPARFPNATIAFVLPTNTIESRTRRNDSQEGGQAVWRPW